MNSREHGSGHRPQTHTHLLPLTQRDTHKHTSSSSMSYMSARDHPQGSLGLDGSQPESRNENTACWCRQLSVPREPCSQPIKCMIKDTCCPSSVQSANTTVGKSFSSKDLSLEGAILFLIRYLVCSILVQLPKYKIIVLRKGKHTRMTPDG